jgi:drug/metabolite transporter (DMT)-like permease
VAGGTSVSARAWVVFALVSILWGIPYLFIKIAVDGGMPPVALAWARILLGAVVLLAIGWRAGTLAQLRGCWGWIAVFAVVELAVPFPLIAAGEQHVASSTVAIVIATAPLMAAMLAIRFEPSERADAKRLAGLVVGLVGVAALVGLDVSGNSGELAGILAGFGAALCYAVGAMLLKRHLSGLDPIAAMGGALAIAAALLTPFALLTLPGTSPTPGAWGSVVVLGILCTAAALALMARLVSEVGAGRALVVTYVNPVIAVALGVVFLSESPGAGSLIGLALILLGSWVSTGGRVPPSEMPDVEINNLQRR